MNASQSLCLGRFKAHSCYSWYWSEGRRCYRHECSLFGCSFSETTETLAPTGQTIIVGGIADHNHDWAIWQSTEDQLGLYIPPWLYKRACRACNGVQMAEGLEKEVK